MLKQVFFVTYKCKKMRFCNNLVRSHFRVLSLSDLFLSLHFSVFHSVLSIFILVISVVVFLFYTTFPPSKSVTPLSAHFRQSLR